MRKKRLVACVFAVREFVAECPKCGETLESPRLTPEPTEDGYEYVGQTRFSECETPVRIGSVVHCSCCDSPVVITDPARIFRLRIRGDRYGMSNSGWAKKAGNG